MHSNPLTVWSWAELDSAHRRLCSSPLLGPNAAGTGCVALTERTIRLTPRVIHLLGRLCSDEKESTVATGDQVMIHMHLPDQCGHFICRRDLIVPSPISARSICE